jgi:hypothetical protein
MPVSRLAVRMRVGRRHGSRLLSGLATACDSGIPISVLCERASAALAEFSAILADDVSEAAQSHTEADVDWLRRQYATMLGKFAVAVRDLIPDRDARHGLAQAIQCAILRHELRLRDVLAATVQK